MAQTNTTLQQLEKPTPGTGAAADIALINRNMDKLDKIGFVFVTSTTRPSTGLFNGLRIYETDTQRTYIWNGSTWILIADKLPLVKRVGTTGQTITGTNNADIPGTAYTFTKPTGWLHYKVEVTARIPVTVASGTAKHTIRVIENGSNGGGAAATTTRPIDGVDAMSAAHTRTLGRHFIIPVVTADTMTIKLNYEVNGAGTATTYDGDAAYTFTPTGAAL